MRCPLIAAALLTVAGVMACATAPAPSGAFARVNGIRMYYELHGEAQGVPLVLIHGGGSTIDATWGRILESLSRHGRVIAVEEQGHGRTSDREGPYRFETSADDVAALVESLGLDQVDVFGFSNGASTALQMAIRHPERIRRLVYASSMTRRNGAQPQLWEFMKAAEFSNMPQALKDAFLRVNSDTAQLRRMHDKDRERMLSFRDLPERDLRTLRARTLVVLGDRDVVTLEHALEIVRLIPQARLLVLPAGHGDYIGEVVATEPEDNLAEHTAAIITGFLRAPIN